MVISIIPIGNHKSFRFANHFHSEERIILNFPVKVGQYYEAYAPTHACRLTGALMGCAYTTHQLLDSLPLNSAGWRGFDLPLKAHNVVCSKADKRLFADEIIQYDKLRTIFTAQQVSLLSQRPVVFRTGGCQQMAQYTYKTVAHPYALPSAIRRSHQPFVTVPFLLICKINFLLQHFYSSCLYYCNSSLIYLKSAFVICKTVFQKASNLGRFLCKIKAPL